MHQAAGVHGAERLGQAGRQPPGGRLRERALGGDRGGQRWPGHERGGQPQRVAIEPGGHHGCGVGPADLPGRGHLTAEPGAERLVVRQFRMDDLDGHGAPRGGGAQVNPAHPAGPEPGPQPVGPDGPRVVGGEGLHAGSDQVPRKTAACAASSARHRMVRRQTLVPAGRVARRRPD